MAAEAARRGYRIALHYRSSRSEAEDLAREIRMLGAEAEIFRAELGDEERAGAMVAEVFARFGAVNLAVNCASTWLERNLAETSAEDLKSEFASNVLATFLVSKLVGLRMCEIGEPCHILTIGDWAVERPYLDHSAYLISKGTIPTLTRVLAVELGTRNPCVRVNCLALGPVLAAESASELEIESTRRATLVKRLGRPENVCKAVFSLTENDFVTGSVLTIDGGRSIFANDA